MDDYSTGDIKGWWRGRLLAAGAVAVGFARAEPVDGEAWARYGAWLGQGRDGELRYMRNYPELRRDPRGLLEGARTLISVAWPYLPERLRDPALPFIARYAYAPDYHKSIRKVLRPVLAEWRRGTGTEVRVCVDSAPVLERWWAVKAGVGFTGRNGCLIVPGYGSWVYLTEILVTQETEPDSPCTLSCAGCGACVKVCPTGALGDDGLVDCRRCLSALTVESPGQACGAYGGRVVLAGCDRCQEVCPHNRAARPTGVAAFATLQGILTLDGEEIGGMSPEEFKERYGSSALSRMGLEGLRANLEAGVRG